MPQVAVGNAVVNQEMGFPKGLTTGLQAKKESQCQSNSLCRTYYSNIATSDAVGFQTAMSFMSRAWFGSKDKKNLATFYGPTL